MPPKICFGVALGDCPRQQCLVLEYLDWGKAARGRGGWIEAKLGSEKLQLEDTARSASEVGRGKLGTRPIRGREAVKHNIARVFS
jgi:hypothetical protein